MATDDAFSDPALVDFRDPHARSALEELGRSTWDEALDWLYGEAFRRPIAGATYPEARRTYFGPTSQPSTAPRHGTPWHDVLATFRERIAPNTYNAQHPGSFSYFTPPPLPTSIAGEVLSQWLQQGVDVWHAGPVGAFVEEEVVAWLRELVGMPEGSWGVLTSGGVMANVMALTVARDIHLTALRQLATPPRGRDLEGVRVYASDQAHFSIARGLDVLGFPPETLRIVPSDERFRLHAAPIASAVADDRAAGLTPLCIAAVAGTTNTGSVDLVPELAELARREGMWLHVDAAYGGAARLSARDATRVPGLELADSVTVDPHKWFFQAYDIGALVVRRHDDLLRTFHRSPEYYASARPDDEPLDWYRYSFEGTRRFRALKLWTSWLHLGTTGLGALVERNDDLAAYLASRLREAPDLELTPDPPELSVVCFRHVPEALADDVERLDRYQLVLQRAIEVDGAAWVSVTTLRGRRWLRAGVVNYLSTEADVDALIDAVDRLSPDAIAIVGDAQNASS
ncbi:MAG TPA: aminotransferase class V-fold PLP-dependent enzyme [Actinomycetota bacterium]|nr:aminotransferase class V-fold PLP-dependent enzyme [Actinomycetota bacterium]